ncbi:hypothetical protein JTB14_000852 [Gonioctena quinquepunctata]|nr:hypothetical protein JTB14_000852 [Gonioctena quinquepunctata]
MPVSERIVRRVIHKSFLKRNWHLFVGNWFKRRNLRKSKGKKRVFEENNNIPLDEDENVFKISEHFEDIPSAEEDEEKQVRKDATARTKRKINIISNIQIKPGTDAIPSPSKKIKIVGLTLTMASQAEMSDSICFICNKDLEGAPTRKVKHKGIETLRKAAEKRARRNHVQILAGKEEKILQ